jgi:hypothetical protein
MRDVRLLFVCIAVLVLAASAGATNQPVNPVRATMTTASTMPVADTPWRYTIVVKDRGGKPLRAKARLQILLGMRVVGCWTGTAMARCSGAASGTWITFKGKRTGVLSWPAQSAGSRRTFVATVVAGGRSLKLRAPVTVKLP